MNKKFLSTFVIILIVFASLAFASVGSAVPAEKVAVIIGFKGVSDAALVHAHGGEITYQYQYVSAIAASLPPQAIAALQKNPNVAYVEPDFEVQALGKPAPTQPPEVTQWGVNKIGAPAVWTSYTGLTVNVAVLDTGIDTTHKDLVVAGGANFVPTARSYNDDNGHGTHCAGIIAALDNDIGVVGVAPGADLYAVKVLDRRGSGSISGIIAGIEWSITYKMQVISMSLGSTSDSEALHIACDKAYAAGIVLVAAAGNTGEIGNTISYPAAYPSVIAVGATDNSDTVASFSTKGDYLSVVAPGVSIYSTYKGNTYATMSGTSMACPHVAGTVALMLSKNNALSPSDVKILLQTTALGIGSVPNSAYGYGRINALAACQATQLPPAS